MRYGRALLFGVLLAAGSVAAQSPARIAYLSGASSEMRHLAAFKQGMRELGYREGTSYVIEARFASGDMEQLPVLTNELTRWRPALFVAYGQDAALAITRIAPGMPIVLANTADPVASRLVSNLARPGGNITGMSDFHGGTITKRLELFKEIMPRLSRVAVFWRPTNLPHEPQIKELVAAGPRLGMTVIPLEVDSPQDIDRAFVSARSHGAGGILLLGDALLTAHMPRIIELSFKHRIPSMYTVRVFAEAGGLIAYGTDINDLVRRSAGHVDKILRGAKPGDLPIEQPTKFDLVINQRTAKAMGVTVPRALLLRADYVIE